MKRDLVVFARQSDMMGAAVLAPQKSISLAHSYEYKHKPRRLGAPMGEFVSSAYPTENFHTPNLRRRTASA